MLSLDQKTDFNALLPGVSTESGASRRTALKAALGMGYAASVMPIMAQTAIKTPTDGLLVGEVTMAGSVAWPGSKPMASPEA